MEGVFIKNYVSNYNRYIVKNGRVYVYNVRFSNVISFESSSIEEVKFFFSTTNDRKLFELGFIRDDEFEIEEVKLWYERMKFSSTELNIMVIMTYDCNCCCQYCFENLNDTCVGQNTSPLKLISYLSNLITTIGYKKVILHFFGGEPMLEVENMIEIAKQLNKLNVDILYNVITNGTYLSENNVKKLYEYGIKNYQVTIDGTQEMHDSRRPCKDANISCYGTIINNLEILGQSTWADKIGITIRINLDQENSQQLVDIYNALPSFIKLRDSCHNIYIAPVVGVCTCSFSNLMKQRTDDLLKAWHTVKSNKLNISIFPPKYAPCPFHSEISAFYIDLDGNVYNCGGFVGNKNFVERVFDKKLKKFYDRLEQRPKDSCFLCTFFPVCMGGCSYETHQLHNSCQLSYLQATYDDYFINFVRR